MLTEIGKLFAGAPLRVGQTELGNVLTVMLDCALKVLGELLRTSLIVLTLGVDNLGKTDRTAHRVRIARKLIAHAILVESLPRAYHLGRMELRKINELLIGRQERLVADQDNDLVVD